MTRRLICAECPWTSDDPFPHPVGDDATDLPARPTATHEGTR